MRTIHGTAKSNSLTFRLFSLTLIGFAISFASLVSIRAQSSNPADPDNQIEDIKVARVSLIQGSLSMMRGDDPDWFDIRVNMPVQTGDRLYANDDGRAELQFDSNFFVRLDSRTGMDILELSRERAQFRMFSGSLVINLRKQPKQAVEIDTPSGAVTLAEAGEYRINVVSDTRSEVIVWRGDAQVFSDNEITVLTGQRLILETGERDSAEITDMLMADSWDKWNQHRDYQLSKDAQSLDYIADNQSVEGAEDLGEYGNWTNTEEYGEVWTPTDVGSDWAPYQDGGWVWRDPCGWTWVSSEPWGWAPYHYGRWTVLGGRWCWVPGSDRHYSPAGVGWVDHGPKGAIGWVPLSPKDKIDTTRPRGRALDGNHVPYANQTVRNGTSIATREGFVGGKSYHHGGAASEPGVGTGRVVATPQIVPTRASLTTKSADKPNPVRPIPAYFNRTVVTLNNNVPAVRSFTDKVAEIKANGGAPVSAVKLTPSGTKATRQLIPETRYTNQTVGRGEVQQPGAGARTVGPSQTVPQSQRTEITPRPQQQTNINQPQNGGLNPRGGGLQRQSDTQSTNQNSGPEPQGNVYRQQKGADEQQQPTQKPQTATEPPQGDVYQPPAGAKPADSDVQKSDDNPRKQSQPAQDRPRQQQPEQPRPQKPQVQDQQERDRQREQQQGQEQERQRQQQAEQERQRQQQAEQDRGRQQQADQDRQRQQQAEQDRGRQQQADQDRQRQQQAEQERGRQQQAEQERQRQQQAEQDRGRQQQAEQERERQQQAEQERNRQQQADQDRQRQQQADQDRQRQQQAEHERQQQQQADQDRQRQQQADQDRQRQQQADQDRQRQQQAEQERERQQQAEQERQRQQQAEQEQQRQQQAEQERQRQQQAEQERQRQQQAEQERQRQQQAEQERQRQQQQTPKKDPPGGNL